MFSYHQDTQEEIQMCLHCKYKECINCLGPKGSAQNRGKLARLGFSDRQIASRLGLSPKTVLTLRHAAGIPSQRAYCYDTRKTYL